MPRDALAGVGDLQGDALAVGLQTHVDAALVDQAKRTYRHPEPFRDPVDRLDRRAEDLDASDAVPLSDVLGNHSMALAPTELSATAPLKMLAPRLGFRAATMPGFVPAMLPAGSSMRTIRGPVSTLVVIVSAPVGH